MSKSTAPSDDQTTAAEPPLPTNGRPAARVGDVTARGDVITTGDPMFLIDGRPAARVGDVTARGDVIATGNPTFLIGGKPAAGVGDVTARGDVIVTGSPTLFIGSARSSSQVTGIPVAIPANANSIVCRNERLVVQNNNSGPDSACTQAHEEQHIRDWKERYGENLCQGISDGHLPVGGDGYDEFLRQSECRAYRVGKACRENLLGTAPDEDKPAIQRGIDRDDVQLRSNSCD
ncbi:PAAR domain-containing protein [Candidatus Thiosymbion oneisti]|uniref:PAAR domain-containing protein n=1 Tax=Candidatus Thiosymbion oneisti TaxID=589554 RepID=UPI000B05ABAF|nr:PAAR domain-containing protein [Candidatus Thiosymbion oneisti]